MMTLVDLPAEQVERLDRFCLKHDRERDYIVRGAIELLMDVIDRDEYRVVREKPGLFEKISWVIKWLVAPVGIALVLWMLIIIIIWGIKGFPIWRPF